MLNQQPALDLVFQALADPTRRQLVERLCRGPASVTELAGPLEMSLPAVLQHLQVLEASTLVRTEKVGRVRTCRVDSGTLRTAEQWIAQRRTSWERSLDRLGDYLAESEAPSADTRNAAGQHVAAKGTGAGSNGAAKRAAAKSAAPRNAAAKKAAKKTNVRTAENAVKSRRKS